MTTVDKLDVSTYLDGTVIGFLEGTSDGIKKSVKDNFKRRFDIDIPLEAITVIIDDLQNPPRRCMSIHVDHEGQHYESVIRNLNYHTGYED